MISLLSDTAIRIRCSNCNCMVVKSMKWVKSHNRIACICGTSVNLNNQQLKSAIIRDELCYENLNYVV